MCRSITQYLWIAATILLLIGCERQNQPRPQPTGELRPLADTVGFSFTRDQIAAVVQLAERLEQPALQQQRQQFGDRPWIAGICPHDDHLLAGRVYVHLFQNLRARRYLIFGVAHKARDWGAENVLIFDNFDGWRAPYGPMKISTLRKELIESLPQSDFVVNNNWQSIEHSVEGIVPFIQHYQRQAEVVSILVPYMDWQRIETLSEHLAAALATIIKRHQWQLGEDIAFICSNDGDHYGDQDWGGRNLAPFGADAAGYLKATQQDSSLIREQLTGELTAAKLHDFCDRVWGKNDIREYQIRWCGRFAIPLGLNTVRALMTHLDHQPLQGYLLRYDTSYQLGKLPLDIGLGTTAPNNIHHWVGYSAIGYF